MFDTPTHSSTSVRRTHAATILLHATHTRHTHTLLSHLDLFSTNISISPRKHPIPKTNQSLRFGAPHHCVRPPVLKQPPPSSLCCGVRRVWMESGSAVALFRLCDERSPHTANLHTVPPEITMPFHNNTFTVRKVYDTRPCLASICGSALRC